MTQAQICIPTLEISISNPKPISRKAIFSDLFLEAIDSAFDLLGERSKCSFYAYLETNLGIDKSEIPNTPQVFVSAVENIFGCAAEMIEIGIIRELHKSVPDFKFAGKEAFTLMDYLESLRFFIQETRDF